MLPKKTWSNAQRLASSRARSRRVQEKRPAQKLALDDPAQPVPRPLWHDHDFLEGKLRFVFALPREDHDPEFIDGGKLPVDVLHLRLEKRRTVARDSATTIHAAS